MGIEFERQTSVAPEVMQILVRVYMSVMNCATRFSMYDENGNPNKVARQQAMHEMCVQLKSFWGVIRNKVRAKDRGELDFLFYGGTMEYKDGKKELKEPTLTFESEAQSFAVMRDVFEIAAENGIFMDFSMVLENYESFGRKD